jgi:dihydrofolate synthase/folylpolyglutamate synthase
LVCVYNRSWFGLCYVGGLARLVGEKRRDSAAIARKTRKNPKLAPTRLDSMKISQVEADLLARQPETDMVPTLDRVAKVMQLLGDPQHNFRVIHVTGTNGKTSTARMIEALVRAAGLRTGLFTSPHLHSVTERVVIDGSPLSEEDFVAAYQDVAPYIAMIDQELEIDDSPGLTFFEAFTCLAFASFADAPIDVAIVEVGLGGQWDATNVATADVAVVTPISLDHTDWLGTDLVKIASEKSGIIKADSAAVLAGQSSDVSEVLLARCAAVGAVPVLQGVDFSIKDRSLALGGQLLTIQGVAGVYDEVFLPLYGRHQAENAALAVAAVESLLSQGEHLSAELIAALESVSSPARLEVVDRSPTVIVDAAHNPAGAAALVEALSDSFSFQEAVGLVSVMTDKDIAGILRALRPAFARVVFTANSSPRAASATELARVAEDLGLWRPEHVAVSNDLESALSAAKDTASRIAGDRSVAIVATGSVVTAAEVRLLCDAPPVAAAPAIATMETEVDSELEMDGDWGGYDRSRELDEDPIEGSI